MYSISIIGSFKKIKVYEKVVEYVEFFKSNGVTVNSPVGSRVIKDIDEFVIFETDNQFLSPVEIQQKTLEKILLSDIVYVCSLDGYVGRTTCYEIGVCLSKGKKLFFLERPRDLPIYVSDDQIVDKEELLSILKEKSLSVESGVLMNRKKTMMDFSEYYSLVQEKTIKRIVICGSMRFYNQMLECKEKLYKNGIEAIVPKEESSLPSNITEEEFRLFKKRVSSAYLKKIREKETAAILVYNEKKNDLDNYIGANTFVEIAMAFAWNRKIYLYNNIYNQYEDELRAWDVIPLNHNMDELVRLWNMDNPEKDTNMDIQMTLWDNPKFGFMDD